MQINSIGPKVKFPFQSKIQKEEKKLGKRDWVHGLSIVGLHQFLEPPKDRKDPALFTFGTCFNHKKQGESSLQLYIS